MHSLQFVEEFLLIQLCSQADLNSYFIILFYHAEKDHREVCVFTKVIKLFENGSEEKDEKVRTKVYSSRIGIRCDRNDADVERVYDEKI